MYNIPQLFLDSFQNSFILSPTINILGDLEMTISAIRRGEYGSFLGVNSDNTFTVQKRNKVSTLKVVGGKVCSTNPASLWNPNASKWRKTFPQIKIPESDFFSTETTIPMYDSAMEDPDYFYYEKGISVKLEYMTPMEYIRACAAGRIDYKTRKLGISIEREMNGTSPSLITKYASAMLTKAFKSGKKFPVPTIEYDKRGTVHQEGRHRALAVQQLINEGKLPSNYKIPVVVVEEV